MLGRRPGVGVKTSVLLPLAIFHGFEKIGPLTVHRRRNQANVIVGLKSS
jgi:hypothetical protein